MPPEETLQPVILFMDLPLTTISTVLLRHSILKHAGWKPAVPVLIGRKDFHDALQDHGGCQCAETFVGLAEMAV